MSLNFFIETSKQKNTHRLTQIKRKTGAWTLAERCMNMI